MEKIKIAVASGKGGTGKTTVSTALALSIAGKSQCELLDCDVEEPNCELLLNAGKVDEEDSFIPFFEFNSDKCTGCGKCKDVCRFNCIAIVRGKAMLFPDLCHGCAGCYLACKFDAVKEIKRKNGVIRIYEDRNFKLISGKLNVGEAMAAPLVKNVKNMSQSEIVVIDSPPGASCSMVSAVMDSDYVVMVTEPTPFGLNDLVLAIDVLDELGLSYGVVINRNGIGDDRVEKYCAEKNVEILGKIDNDLAIAQCYSRGLTPYDRVEHFTEQINLIVARLMEKKL